MAGLELPVSMPWLGISWIWCPPPFVLRFVLQSINKFYSRELTDMHGDPTECVAPPSGLPRDVVARHPCFCMQQCRNESDEHVRQLHVCRDTLHCKCCVRHCHFFIDSLLSSCDLRYSVPIQEQVSIPNLLANGRGQSLPRWY